MTENLKCPFCGQELEEETFARGRVFVSCNNPNCIISDWGGCSKQIITELIRTRKALDVAKEGLKEIQDKGEYVNPIELAESYLDEITALEQKDK